MVLSYHLLFAFRGVLVRIYNGAGTEDVTKVVIPSLYDAFKRLNVLCKISPIDSGEMYGNWPGDTDLFILPGGRDLPYVSDLQGRALQNIREFIKSGGSYLGLCAGAYFSSESVSFEAGTSYEVTGPRELKLFRGIAEGSVYPGFNYKSKIGVVSAPIISCGRMAQVFTESFAYFNGGCHFICSDSYREYETLAEYKDFPNRKAIVQVEIGKGKVVLSGVHPEYDVKYLEQGSYSKQTWDTMEKNNSQQRMLLDWILKLLI